MLPSTTARVPLHSPDRHNEAIPLDGCSGRDRPAQDESSCSQRLQKAAPMHRL